MSDTRELIYLSAPDITASEERSVFDAVRSGWVAPLGPDVDAFEREVADRVGRRYGVALSSGTAALHMALVAWNVGAGDFVPTSTMTFAATANAIRYTGATPVFIDSDPVTGNLDVALLDEAVSDLRAQGRRVPAIVPVDLLGKCADYAAIRELAERHDVRVLVDSAESLGAGRDGYAAGGFGDAAILSFNGNKIITTSGGGMLLTDAAGMAARARFLAAQAREPVAHYEHREVGYNYRLSNVLAALGRAQLRRLDEMMKRRRMIREVYVELFDPVAGAEVFGRADDALDNCWLTAILLDERQTGWSSSDLRRALSDARIEARPLWKPMHLQPVFTDHPAYVTGAAESLFERGVTLPSGSSLTDAQVARITGCISEFVGSRA